MNNDMFKIKTADPLGILETTAGVLKEAKFVSFDFSLISQITSQLLKFFKKSKYPEVLPHFGFSDQTEKGVQLLLVEDAINFCYWPDPGKERWVVEYPKGQISKGGWLTMTLCFTRALKEGKPLWDANYLKNLDKKEAQESFRSCNSTEIPLLEERVKCLNEVGTVLLEKYNGQAKNIIEEVNFDAIDLVKIIVRDFPSFCDISNFNGKEIPFLKRAQIFPWDLSLMFNNKSFGRLSRVNELTAFADYKVPQMLRRLGLIRYLPELANKIDNLVPIKSGSQEEVEIRSATIWGVEFLRQEINGATASEIDSALWETSQDANTQEKPYHRTRTVYY